jgi:hypothetical protein
MRLPFIAVDRSRVKVGVRSRPLGREGGRLPSYLQPLSKLETVVFDPGLCTAAELVAMSFSPVDEQVPRGNDPGRLGVQVSPVPLSRTND